MKNTFKLGLYALSIIILASCKKDETEPTTPTTPAATTDNVLLKIEHTWNGADFALDTDFQHPITGDDLNFSTFKYYISNIRLKKANGTWWTQPDSYFLLNISNGSTSEINLTNVPVGEYTDIEYVLGVDSTMNVSGPQTGALSTANGMFWSWNSGYIMLKAEGISTNSTSGSFTFHLGGFSGANNIVTTKTHNFTGNSLSALGNGNCQIHLSAKPEALWATAGSVSGTSNLQMPGAMAKTMALDFYGSFEFEHIHE